MATRRTFTLFCDKHTPLRKENTLVTVEYATGRELLWVPGTGIVERNSLRGESAKAYLFDTFNMVLGQEPDAFSLKFIDCIAILSVSSPETCDSTNTRKLTPVDFRQSHLGCVERRRTS